MDNLTLKKYKNALETIVFFMSNKSKSLIELKRVEAAINFLYDDRNEDVI